VKYSVSQNVTDGLSFLHDDIVRGRALGSWSLKGGEVEHLQGRDGKLISRLGKNLSLV
jgi:hypothetical protein